MLGRVLPLIAATASVVSGFDTSTKLNPGVKCPTLKQQLNLSAAGARWEVHRIAPSEEPIEEQEPEQAPEHEATATATAAGHDAFSTPSSAPPSSVPPSSQSSLGFLASASSVDDLDIDED